MLKFYDSESLVQPVGIDKTSSEAGVYVRICVTQTTEDDQTKYNYKEAYLTKAEWEQYVLIQTLKNQATTRANIQYLYRLDTPVVYPTNGFTYRPKWAEEIYAEKIQQGKVLPDLFPLRIYDSTGREDHAQDMTIADLTALSMYLASQQEIYFREKKQQEIADGDNTAVASSEDEDEE